MANQGRKWTECGINSRLSSPTGLLGRDWHWLGKQTEGKLVEKSVGKTGERFVKKTDSFVLTKL